MFLIMFLICLCLGAPAWVDGIMFFLAAIEGAARCSY